jgi:hypothetical protein
MTMGVDVQSPEWPSTVGPRLDVLRDAHANLLDIVKFEDTKAAALIGVHALLVAILGSNLIDRFLCAVHDRSAHPAVSVFGLLMLASTIVSLCAAFVVLMPRWRSRVKPPKPCARLMWIGKEDLGRFDDKPNDYLDEAAKVLPQAVMGDLVYENLKIARILRGKFFLVTICVWATATAVACWAVVLVLIVVDRIVCP